MSRKESLPVLTRVPPETKRRLVEAAREHNRSVAAETRAALDIWLDAHRLVTEAGKRASG